MTSFVPLLLLAITTNSLGSAVAGSNFDTLTIYSNVNGLSSNEVPDLPTVRFSGFDRPYCSPNGNWVLTSTTDLPGTENEILILNGATIAREGTQAPWSAAGENWGPLETKMGVNDTGQIAISNETSNWWNPNEYVVRRDANGTWTPVAIEGVTTGLGVLPGTT